MAKHKSSKSQQSSSAQNAHITKITAKPSAPAKTTQIPAQPTEPAKTEPVKTESLAKAEPTQNKPVKAEKKAGKHRREKSRDNTEKPLREVFLLARPFVAIGRYLRDSWRELRLVRWPSRGNTWKMTFAVLVYCAIFIVFIILIDSLFTFIFNILLGQQ